MENTNQNDLDEHYSDKYSLDSAALFDAADDERAFLKPFPADRRREVARIFLDVIAMHGMCSPQGLVDLLRIQYEHEEGVFYCFHAEITEANKAFDEQVWRAVNQDPMAFAYAAYVLEYVMRVLLPSFLSSQVSIPHELPMTVAQHADFTALSIPGFRDYNRRTAGQKIVKVKAKSVR